MNSQISIRRSYFPVLLAMILGVCGVRSAPGEEIRVEYQGKAGPGLGKKIVFVTGDDEYRSEEGMPQLAKILAVRHGFHCTVLFAINPSDGTITPSFQENIPGLESLKDADLMVLFARFRNLPDDQMQHVVDYVESGRPIVALRTSTHAFNIPEDRKFSLYSWNNPKNEGGFGRKVLGETWISHHGEHGKQSTRGIVDPGNKEHCILRGIKDGDIWGPTDVYGVRLPLPEDSAPLVLGQVLTGMKSDDAPLDSDKNRPMMPIAWTKSYKGTSGKTARTFTTTMGASQDLLSEGLRRLLTNACYWALEMDDKISPDADVSLVGEYKPTPFGFNTFTKGVHPRDHELK